MSNGNNTIGKGVEGQVEQVDSSEVVEASVVDTQEFSTRVEQVLPNEVEQFIAKFNFSLNGDKFVLSDSLKSDIAETQENFQNLKEQGKQINDLFNRVEDYLNGIKILNEELDNEGKKKDGLIGRYLGLAGNKIKRLPVVGEYASKVMSEVKSFDRNIMQELGDGGLMRLVEDSEDAINSVQNHYEAIEASYTSAEKLLNEINTNLGIVSKYLENPENSEVFVKLAEIKEDLESELLISEKKLEVASYGIEYYKLNIAKLVKSLPKSLASLNISVMAYQTGESGKIVGDLSDNFDDLTVETALSSLKMIKKSAEQTSRRLQANDINERIADEMLKVLPKINEANAQISQEINKQKQLSHKGKSSALDKLKALNAQSENLLENK